MRDSLVLSYDLPASAAQAFYVYVEGLAGWWPATYTADPATFCGLRLDARPGGRLVAAYSDGREVEWGRVEMVEAGQRLRHTFFLPHAGGTSSTVELVFSEHDAGSRLTFREEDRALGHAFDKHRFGDWPVILGNYVDAVRRSATHRP